MFKYLFVCLALFAATSVYAHEGMIHAGAQIPDYAYEPDTYTVKSGNWFDTSVWSNGVPTAVVDAEIMVGHAVEIDSIVYDADFDNDGDIDSADYLLVRNGDPGADINGDGVVNNADVTLFVEVYFGIVVSIPPQDAVVDDLKVSGKLSFSRTENTKLVVKTFTNLGELDYGTEASPILAKCETVFRDAPLDTAYDPEQWGHGLIQVSGKFHSYGVRNTPYSRCLQPALAGQTVLVLEDAVVNWNPGDQLYVPDTSGTTGTTFAQAEVVTIASVNGNSITLTAPLQFNHTNQYTTKLPHVANLNDNIIMRSENPNGTRGHIVNLGRSEVDVHDMCVDGMGRTRVEQLDLTHIVNGAVLHVGTNQIARYAFHMHHFTGPLDKEGPQFVIADSVVKNNKKWGIVVHHSSHGLVDSNVVVFADGACIVCEDGNEYGNTISRNFAAYCKGSGQGVQGRGSGNGGGDPRVVGTGTVNDPFRTDGDQGHEGSIFWARSMSNNVQDNVFVNGRQAVTEWCRFQANQDVPNFKGADIHSQVTSQPPGKQYDFQFSNNENYGCPLGYHILGLDYSGLFGNIVSWATPEVINLDYSTKVQFVNGDWTGVRLNRGRAVDVGFASYSLDGITVRDFYTGLVIEEATTVKNSHFACTNSDIAISDGRGPGGTTIIDNVTFSDSVRNISFGWNPTFKARVYTISSHVLVYNYNGMANDNFKMWIPEQDKNYIWNKASTISRFAPVDGLKNSVLWDLYRTVPMGQMIPDVTFTRPGVGGVLSTIPLDMVRPVISNVSVVTTNTTATIKWKTSEPCSSQVEHKAGTAEMEANKYYVMNPVNPAMLVDHQLVLAGLTPNTNYEYLIRVFDASNNLGDLSNRVSSLKMTSTPNFKTKP